MKNCLHTDELLLRFKAFIIAADNVRISAGAIATFRVVGKAAEVGTRHARVL